MLCESISFPALGAGSIFGFPMQVVCLAIYSAMEEFVMNTVDSASINVKKVRILLKHKETVQLFEREFLRRYSLCDVYVNDAGEIAVNDNTHGSL